MNSESLTNVLTRRWRIVTGSKTVNSRNRMPETGASGPVGAPLEESGALPGSHCIYDLCTHSDPNGIRTRVTVVKGRKLKWIIATYETLVIYNRHCSQIVRCTSGYFFDTETALLQSFRSIQSKNVLADG